MGFQKDFEEFSDGIFTKFSRTEKAGLISLIVLLIVGTGILVYLTGGIKFVYAHTMYLSIVFAAYFFYIPGGLISGIAGGLILGPWMPIDVLTGEMQLTENWVFRLMMFVAVGVMLGAMFTRNKKQIEKIQWMIYHDIDTGIPNRAYLLKRFEQITREADPSAEFALFTILMNNHAQVISVLDIDEIRSLYIEIFERLCPIQQDCEKAFQLFPYIFCVLFQIENGEQECEQIVSRIFDELQSSVDIQDIPIFVDVCIGVSTSSVKNIDISSMLRKAKIASLIAREREEKFWIFSEKSDAEVRDTQILLGGVTEAIEKNQFTLHYQPIINICDGEMIGVEALIRWMHPVSGLIPPGKFLPSLERTSLMYAVHDWVLETAIKEMAKWNGYKGFMSINLSTRVLLDQKWLMKLKYLLEQTGIDPSRIIFEITETAIMADIEKTQDFLTLLKQTGVLISLDDFGTGYSSLEYIQRLPLDYLKIDRKFIQNIATLEKSQVLVKLALQMAKSLGIEVIGEGVEQESEYLWLLDEACKYAQGYYFSKPMPEEQLQIWISEKNWSKISD